MLDHSRSLTNVVHIRKVKWVCQLTFRVTILLLEELLLITPSEINPLNRLHLFGLSNYSFFSFTSNCALDSAFQPAFLFKKCYLNTTRSLYDNNSWLSDHTSCWLPQDTHGAPCQGRNGGRHWREGPGEAAQRLGERARHGLQGWGVSQLTLSRHLGRFTIQHVLPRLDAAKLPSCVRTRAHSFRTPGQQNPQPPQPLLA